MRIVVSAGPTREYLDPVRFLSNTSSGKMGYAIARAARKLGHETILVSGPVSIPAPEGVRVIRVVSAAEMAEAVFREAARADAVIMAAAVADYRPALRSDGKIKKSDGELVLRLERTTDILAELGRRKSDRQRLIGFAAESENLLEYARGKILRKNLDWIAANRISDGFGTDTNVIELIDRAGNVCRLGPAPKEEIAEALLAAVLA